jgi:DNA topoisomerase-6 subunit B
MAEKLAAVTGRPALNIEDTMARIMNNVLVERERADGRMRLTIENNSDAGATLEVTDIVDAEPALDGTNGDADDTTAQVVEMDGEYFLKWAPEVPADGEATLEYEVDADAEAELTVEGIEEEKLTVDDAGGEA